MLGDNDKNIQKHAVNQIECVIRTTANLDHNWTSESSKLHDKSSKANLNNPCMNVRQFKLKFNISKFQTQLLPSQNLCYGLLK